MEFALVVFRRLRSLRFLNSADWSQLFHKTAFDLGPDATCIGRGFETLEDRMMLSALQFIADQATLYDHSENPADSGSPAVFMYKDYYAGGVFTNIEAGGVPTNGLDGNDQDAARGLSSFRMTTDAAGGYLEFGLAKTNNSPRDIPEYGFVHHLRFWAKGESAGQEMVVKLLKTKPGGGFEFVDPSTTIPLSTSWEEYVVDPPAGLNLTPHQVFAVQFQLPEIGTVLLDEVRLNTDGTDPLQLIQSFVPNEWSAETSVTTTREWRNSHIYPSRSSLYDVALAAKALIASGDADKQSLAINQLDVMLATAVNGSEGYYNQHNSGYILLADGTPRGPASLVKTVGDNSWFGLALLDGFRMTGNELYLTRAREISDWIDSTMKSGGALKGYFGGYDENGAKVTWRSTEHNIDAFELNRQIEEMLLQRNETSAANEYHARADWAATFVIAMFEDVEGKFWTGTTVGDAINTDSVPLDAQLWPMLTLKLSPDYAAALPWTNALDYAEANIVATDGAVSGFTFGTNSMPDIVWSEGVGQGVEVYNSLGDNVKAQAGLDTLDQLVGPHDGIFAASSDELSGPLGAIYDKREAVAPTVWAYLGGLGLNAFGTVVPGVFDPASVDIYATNGDDTIEFVAGSKLTVTVNGQTYSFDKSLNLPIAIHGLSGNDSIEMFGGAGDETADLRVASVEMREAEYLVTVDEVENVRVVAGAGNDRANLYDSTFNDKFYGRKAYSYLTGNGFFNRVDGFDKVYAYGTTGGAGGLDQAYLYDSAGNDTFRGRPTFSDMTGNGFFIRGTGFDKVYAYGNTTSAGGLDQAFLYDSEGNDTFYGRPTVSDLTGSGFFNRATGFDKVFAYAIAGGDNDRALFYDLADNDTFKGRPTVSDMTGIGFFNRASGFDKVFAYATAGDAGGVGDRAFLYDSAGNDSFYGRKAYSYMTGSNFFNQASGFDNVYAYATAGDAGGVGDRAFFYDTAGDDTFFGRNDYGRLTGDGFLIFGQGFARFFAYANQGGFDTINNRSLAYDFLQYGTWEHIL